MEKPNIVFLMVDQMPAEASGLYGERGAKTPNLEEMAKDGVTFKNSSTPQPLCVPARTSLWTSQFPHTHGSRRNETLMPEKANHVFKLWHEQGFHTGLIGKNHCFTSKDRQYFDTWCEIGHQGVPKDSECKNMEWVRSEKEINKAHQVRNNMPKQARNISYAVTDHDLGLYSTGLIAEQSLSFFDNVDSPFSLWVSFPDPHGPFEVPRDYFSKIRMEDVTLPPWDDQWLESAPDRAKVLHQILGVDQNNLRELKENLRVYHAKIRFLDDAIGKIIKGLDSLGLKENTILVFCSDHGDFFGHYRMIRKGGLFSDPLIRVPLIFSWKGITKSNITVDSPVNLIDIVPTLLHLQNINIPQTMQGNLLPGVTDTSESDFTYSEYGAGGPLYTLEQLEKRSKPYGLKDLMGTLRWREAEGRAKMVRSEKWKYTYFPFSNEEELYNLESDPYELNNLADKESYTEKKHTLQKNLLDWSINTEDGEPVSLPREVYPFDLSKTRSY